MEPAQEQDAAARPTRNPPCWKNNKAKLRLYKLLIDGTIPLQAERGDGRGIFNAHCLNHPDFEDFPEFDSNFQPRLNRLREAIRSKYSRAKADREALEHDRQIYPELDTDHRGNVAWHRSEAPKLLKQDIDNKLHEDMPPRDLWVSRAAYIQFSLEQFRCHIHQEVASRKFREQYIPNH